MNSEQASVDETVLKENTENCRFKEDIQVKHVKHQDKLKVNFEVIKSWCFSSLPVEVVNGKKKKKKKKKTAAERIKVSSAAVVYLAAGSDYSSSSSGLKKKR
ncbi:hypothetical protein TYRP_022696 [Tyrophagus putrescentiae]|nr:hypothetical protein TYRP_022696 [Tyrophagus putrescentiae]